VSTLLILRGSFICPYSWHLYNDGYRGKPGCCSVGKSYLDSLKHISENIKEINLSFFSALLPCKGLRKGIEKAIRDKGAFTDKLYRNALKIAYSYNGIGWDKEKDYDFPPAGI